MKWLLKAAPYALVALVIFLLGSWVYNAGSHSGASSVQKAWDADKALTQAKMDALKQEYDDKEEKHRAENQRITHELAEAQRQYEVALATQSAEYNSRLQQSSARANVYKRQAESGSVESRRLASHAAELDRSLEEGRHLVRELRETLGLRDRQLKELAAQILSDRALLNTEGDTNGNGSN